MENISVSNQVRILNDRIDITRPDRETTTGRKTGFSPSVVKIIAEGGENFFLYLKRFGFLKEVNMLVLSSVHHYFYDEKELVSVRTLVTIKKLNHINHLDSFLQNLAQILPPDTNFIGCFSNDKTLKQNGVAYYKPSRLLRKFINFIDSKTDHILDKSKVSEILERNGHKIIDMTEMDGLTFFYSKTSETSRINSLAGKQVLHHAL
jgi:hypothetical protein